MVNRMRSPTRARTVGPGTWSPNVHALYFTPGAISTTLCTVSRRISLTGAGSMGFNVAVVDSAFPAAKGPVPAVLVTRAGFGFRSIFAGSYGSETLGARLSHATRDTTNASQTSRVIALSLEIPRGTCSARASESRLKISRLNRGMGEGRGTDAAREARVPHFADRQRARAPGFAIVPGAARSLVGRH